MAAHHIVNHLQDLIGEAITEWFEPVTVQIAQYHNKFHPIFISQEEICCQYA